MSKSQTYTVSFLFSECTCSQDGGVSLRFASCHPTVLRVIASVVHHPMECEQQSTLNVFLISWFCCVFSGTVVSQCASTWCFEFCTFGNMPVFTFISTLATSFSWSLYNVVRSLLLTDFDQHVIAIFSVTFRVSARWNCWRKWTRSSLTFAFLVRVVLEREMHRQKNAGFRWSNGCSLLSRSCFWCSLFAFSFHFPFARSSNCRSVFVSFSSFEVRIFWVSARDVFGPSTTICNSHTSCRQMSSFWAKTCNKYFNSSDFSTCILYKLLHNAVRLSVTADRTSSHYVSRAWTLSLFNWAFDKSLKSKMASLSPLMLKKS